MINKPVLIFAIIYLISIKIHAQDVLYLDKDQPAGNGSIHDLHWIVGYWSGTGLGGVCDELWLPALDNSMVGTFRFMMDRKLIFSEYMNMVEENGTLALKIKHFNKDLTPWEEKENRTTFKFIRSEGQTAYFSGITFHREGDEMTLRLALTNGGVKSIEEFRYKKIDL